MQQFAESSQASEETDPVTMESGSGEVYSKSCLQTKYKWVLDVLGYDCYDTLVEVLDEAVINPALKMRDELEQEKMRNRPMRHVDDYRHRRIEPAS